MIEIIPRPKPKPPFWQGVLLWISVSLLVLSALGYFVLGYLEKRDSQTLQDLEELLAEEKTVKEIDSLEKEVFEHQEKIEDFSRLFSSHQLSSNLFKLLESKTHPQVFWMSISLDTEDLTVSLAGQTQDFQTLGQQISILKEEELISGIDLFDIQLGEEGRVNFKLGLTFLPRAFK
jgi:hypothetical protein